jgi:hypothetical protein
MKKNGIFILLFFFIIYSYSLSSSDYFAEQFFDDFDIQYDYVVINLEGNNSNNLIAHLAIFR